jgi:phosphopantetheinyl transferase
VSIAYAGGAAAIVWGKSPVGIDLELTTATPPEGLDLQAWTRLEALGKAAGTGVRDWPDSVPPDLPTEPLDLPQAYAGTLAGLALGWRFIAPRPA